MRLISDFMETAAGAVMFAAAVSILLTVTLGLLKLADAAAGI